MTTTTAGVEAYAARVRTALADLSTADRDDLSADLEDHLTEVAAEGDLTELLGTPENYAAELRSSAGLAGTAVPATGRRVPDLERWLTATRDFLPELLPGWWVARALLLVSLLTVLGAGGVVLWLLLAVVLVPASVLLGRWFERRSRRRLGLLLDVVATVLLLLTVLTVAGLSMGTGSGYGSPVQEGGGPLPATTGLEGVTNLYPYDKDGRPLTDVQLYDQDGNPVLVQGDQDLNGNPITRVPRYAADGRVVGNAYPQEQTVETYPADPAAAPTVRRLPGPVVRPPTLQPR